MADAFNRAFPKPRKIFPLPQHIISMWEKDRLQLHPLIHDPLASSRRVLSLRDPSSKMSKSSPDVQSRILLTDDFAQIQSKIRSAVTDSRLGVTFDPVNRPGVSNIITILATCTNKSAEEVAESYSSKGHSQLKGDTSEAIEVLMRQPREEFNRLKLEKGYLEEIARDGARRAREISEGTMTLVRSQIGLA